MEFHDESASLLNSKEQFDALDHDNELLIKKKKKRNKRMGRILFLLTQLLFGLALYSSYGICFEYIPLNFFNYLVMYFWLPLIFTLTILTYYRACFAKAGPISVKSAPKITSLVPSISNKVYQITCPICQSWKPPRAYHCKSCNQCVFKMDHHCIWINNCIGYNNQKYFILFLAYNWLFVLSVGYVQIIGIFNWGFRSKRKLLLAIFNLTYSKLCVLAVFILIGCFLVFTTQMLQDQWETIVDNQTVVESEKQICGRTQNKLFTLSQVFGTNKLEWLLPTRPKIILNYAEMSYSTRYSIAEDAIYQENYIYSDKDGRFTQFKAVAI